MSQPRPSGYYYFHHIEPGFLIRSHGLDTPSRIEGWVAGWYDERGYHDFATAEELSDLLAELQKEFGGARSRA